MKLIKFFFFISFVFILSSCGSDGIKTQEVQDDSALINIINVTWQVPSERIDGSFLPDNHIKSFQIYIGRSADTLELMYSDIDPYLTSYDILNLSDGVYYVAVTAVDTNNVESSKSTIQKVVIN